jgi:hypothetical protein
MQAINQRYHYLFRSTKGLILVAIALISLVTAIWGTLSGPLAEWGVKDVTVRVLGMQLDPAEREGRIIILYHTIANAVIAIEVYIITSMIGMKEHERTRINATITVGYILAMVFGLGFAYFGHNWAFHGLFVAGETLVFFAGLLLMIALWPWRREYRNTDPAYANLGGVNLERAAFFCGMATGIGAVLGGAGAYFGNGFGHSAGMCPAQAAAGAGGDRPLAHHAHPDCRCASVDRRALAALQRGAPQALHAADDGGHAGHHAGRVGGRTL